MEAAPAKQSGHGAPIRITSCSPSFSLVPFYPLAQPDSADAGAGGMLGGGLGTPEAPLRGEGPQGSWDGAGSSRSSKSSKSRIFSCPRASCSPPPPTAEGSPSAFKQFLFYVEQAKMLC